MSDAINRGSRPFSRLDTDISRRAAADERIRQTRLGQHASHRVAFWSCPNCGHRQRVEYPVDPWVAAGHVDVRCVVGDSPRDPFACQLASRIRLDGLLAVEWLAWTLARWSYEAAQLDWQRRRNGLFIEPSEYSGRIGPPPRWTTPDPEHAVFDGLRGLYTVRLLEARTMDRPMLNATLHLPSGHINCEVRTDYVNDDGIHVGELIVAQPDNPELREELLALVDDEDRAEYRSEGYRLSVIRPYGEEEYSWKPADGSSTTASAEPVRAGTSGDAGLTADEEPTTIAEADHLVDDDATDPGFTAPPAPTDAVEVIDEQPDEPVDLAEADVEVLPPDEPQWGPDAERWLEGALSTSETGSDDE